MKMIGIWKGSTTVIIGYLYKYKDEGEFKEEIVYEKRFKTIEEALHILRVAMPDNYEFTEGEPVNEWKKDCPMDLADIIFRVAIYTGIIDENHRIKAYISPNVRRTSKQ